MPNTPLPRTSHPGRFSLMKINMPSGKWLTGAIMRVIIPLSLELVLFNEVWYLVLMPPITLVVLVCNLGLFFVLVRPKSWETRILGMMLGGVAAVFAAAANYLLASPGPIPVGARVARAIMFWRAGRNTCRTRRGILENTSSSSART